MNNELVVVNALWCPSCLITKKNLKKITDNYDINIKNLDYDIDEEEVSKLNVSDILPVLIIRKDNVEVSRLVGERTYDDILSFLKENNII